MSEQPKVVSLRGEHITGYTEVQADVVGELARMLEAAELGELVGLAYAACHADATTSNRYVGKLTYGTAGGLMAVTQRLVTLMNGDGD